MRKLSGQSVKIQSGEEAEYGFIRSEKNFGIARIREEWRSCNLIDATGQALDFSMEEEVPQVLAAKARLFHFQDARWPVFLQKWDYSRDSRDFHYA